MNRYLAALFFAGSLLLGSCANDLTVENTDDRGPAPFSPDPISHLPTPPPNSSMGGSSGY